MNPLTIFGTDAKNYDEARLPYPREWLLQVMEDLGVERSARIADIGAGTGKLGRVLEEIGYPVVFVEPCAKSCEFMRNSGIARDKVFQGTSTVTNVPGHSVDMVVFGDSAHWTRATERETLAEMHRILTENGKVAAIIRMPSQEFPLTHEMDRLLTETSADYRSAPYKLIKESGQMRYMHGAHLIAPKNNKSFGVSFPVNYDEESFYKYLKSHSAVTEWANNDPEGFRAQVIAPLFEYGKAEGMVDGDGKISMVWEVNVRYGPAREISLNTHRGR